MNDFLAKGPDCLNNMCGILLRFKEGMIGVIGDLKKMYNSVKISLLDQHCHRFLWRELDVSRNPDVYALTTVTFGDKCGGSVAMMALKETTTLTEGKKEAKRVVDEDAYVDDIITSVDSIAEADSLTSDIDQLIKPGNFQVKEWIRSGMKAMHDCGEKYEEKVLGLKWNMEGDFFFFVIALKFAGLFVCSPEEFENNKPQHLSKRIILSQVARVFDILGLIAPFILLLKLALRELVLMKVDWDSNVSKAVYDKWMNLFRLIFEVEELKFPRCMKSCIELIKPELIIFCDGSNTAYGAVAYIRWEKPDGSVECHLLMAKSKLSPLMKLPIPRIELCSAVVGARLKLFIEGEIRFKFEKVFLFTDSQIVLGQILSDSLRMETYVANRISEIQKLTSTE